MTPFTVLAVGATGSIGGHVLTESLRAGHRVRALIRDPSRAAQLPSGVEWVVGDLTRADTLGDAVDGVDGVGSRTARTEVPPRPRRWTTEPCATCCRPSVRERPASR